MQNIEQKKGNPQALTGRLFAYARILPGPMPEGPFPWAEMVQSGMLVVTGDFQNSSSLAEFLRNDAQNGDEEGGTSAERLADRLREMGEDIPEGLSQEELRERLQNMSHMEIIPVPARVIGFNSEEELLKSDGDIYFIGEFLGLMHAHLAVTSFPILYQALYREQEARKNHKDIDDLLAQVMSGHPDYGDPVVLDLQGSVTAYEGDLRDLLLKTVVPNLIYNLGYPAELLLSLQSFRDFMEGYRWPSDVERIENALQELKNGKHEQALHIELLCEKIAALQQEQFEKLPNIAEALKKFE